MMMGCLWYDQKTIKCVSLSPGQGQLLETSTFSIPDKPLAGFEHAEILSSDSIVKWEWSPQHYAVNSA